MIDAAKRRAGETWRVLTLLTVEALAVGEGARRGGAVGAIDRANRISIEISGSRISLCARKGGAMREGCLRGGESLWWCETAPSGSASLLRASLIGPYSLTGFVLGKCHSRHSGLGLSRLIIS